MTIQTYAGSCHCGKVRVEADLDLSSPGGRCNCTICAKVSSLGMTTKPDAVRVVAGKEHLSEYRKGDSPNSRFFCKHCGIHLGGKGHVPELGGDFASINLNCLENVELSRLKVIYWDGRHNNWQAGPREQPWPMFTA